MSNPKKIEYLDPATNLQDDDLLFTSVRQGGGYVSRKITIEQLAEYINSNPVEIQTGGNAVIYDTETSGASGTTDNTQSFTYTAPKNSELLVINTWGGSYGAWDTTEELGFPMWCRDIKVEIDGVRINWRMFCTSQYEARLFLKEGQTVSVTTNHNTQMNAKSYVQVSPLLSGGVFIDTETMKQSQYLDNGFWKYHVATGLNTNWSLDFDAFVVLHPDGAYKIVDTRAIEVHVDDQIHHLCHNALYDGFPICLKAGQRFYPILTNGNLASLRFSVYPILANDNSGSSQPDAVQLWENGPYWATKNIGAKRDIDFGEYFQYGSLNGYRYENKVYVGNGSDNYEFPTNDSLVYGKSKEQLLQDGIITEDNVLTPNYDAATQKFGSEWKIPSYNDWIALNTYCDMYWTRKNGVEGVMITGRNAYSNKSIFLPNAGAADSNGPTSQIRYSSTKVTYGPTSQQAANAECAYFEYSYQSGQVLVDVIRAVQDGLPIRPIKVVS